MLMKALIAGWVTLICGFVLWPVALIWALAGESENTGCAAAWVTLKVWSAMVMVALRAASVALASTV